MNTLDKLRNAIDKYEKALTEKQEARNRLRIADEEAVKANREVVRVMQSQGCKLVRTSNGNEYRLDTQLLPKAMVESGKVPDTILFRSVFSGTIL
jgi:hypothetical protein